ncbi:DUF4194 domain-containing protein [Oceanispirochaeta sp.]|jgi:hypothetical protein|uniref:DUF4194 domain-containing protein n=1 Tax=Oceanispirochaeta sp. TaxID=2035350 RepID=UPI00261F6A87|nr:DUF4194 domain-containing protein [Oceanispirochaeta sp.]MDA3955344.1 DUF4194 domain-containing protein [Oceanispirochaeta sp.]
MDTQDNETLFSVLLISLMKSVISREDNPARWQQLLQYQGELSDYLARMALDLVIFEDEGFAYLKNKEGEDEEGLPRLISRRPLSYPVSLLLALLRRKMAEHDAGSGEVRIILDRQEIVDMMAVYFPAGINEVQFVRKVEGYMKKVLDMGFLRFLGDEKQKVEIKRILKAFVDAQWLNELDLKLEEYASHSGVKDPAGDDSDDNDSEEEAE